MAKTKNAPSLNPAGKAAEAQGKADAAQEKADGLAGKVPDSAKTDQMIPVVGLKNHECKIIGQRISIVKGGKTEVSKFVYDVLTNPELPGPIVKAIF